MSDRTRIAVPALVRLMESWRAAAPGRPGYQAMADRLRLLVLDGRLPVGTVLPSERALAEAIGVSRTTTTAAYRLLREEGFAFGSQGAGTWTALPTPVRTSSAAPLPGALDGAPSSADGSGDFSTAATEAPVQLHAAYTAALADLPRFLHGNGYLTQGLPELRERIAARYTERGLPTSPDEILVTNGALQALRLVLTTFVNRGDAVLVEHPSYPAAVDSVRRTGGRPAPIPIEGGWDVDRIRTILRQTGARLAYLMPDFQNPTGQVLGAAGREALVAALAEAGCLGIVDETNCELDLRDAIAAVTLGTSAPLRPGEVPHPPAHTPPPMAAFASPGGVICLGSASKVIWGGLRIGWVRAERSTIRRLVMARDADDLAGPVLEQLAAERLLAELPVIAHERRRILAERCVALSEAVATHLPAWDVSLPDGGLSLWCRLPEPASSALTTAAHGIGLRVTPGPRFGLDGAFESRIRLPFARPAEHLVRAARILGEAWQQSGAATAGHVEMTVV